MPDTPNDRWKYLIMWRKALDTTGADREGGLNIANRGDRAALRRCRTIDEVLLQPAFYQIREGLRKDGFEFRFTDADERLAAVVGLVAWIDTDDRSKPFRQQLGRRRPDSDAALLSGLRFRRMLEARNRDELFELLRHTIDLLGRSVHVPDLANDVYYWAPDSKNSTRRNWAEGYYTAAPQEL